MVLDLPKDLKGSSIAWQWIQLYKWEGKVNSVLETTSISSDQIQ